MSNAPRRIEDHLLVAVDMACEQGRLEVAEAILQVVELAVTQNIGADRRERTGPVADAFAKVAALKQSDLAG
jgi:hypothetical protein